MTGDGETYRHDERNPSATTEPVPAERSVDAAQSASTGGVGATEADRRGTPGPGGGAAYDLKSGNLPEPKSGSGG